MLIHCTQPLPCDATSLLHGGERGERLASAVGADVELEVSEEVPRLLSSNSVRSTQLLAERARTTAACAQEIGHKSLKGSSCLHTKLGADGVTHEASHRQAAHRQDVVHQRARLVQCPREQLAPVAASTAPPRQAAVPSTARGAVADIEQTSSVGTPVHLTVHESTLLGLLGGGLVVLGVSHFES